MKKKELEKLLYETVAEALGVDTGDRDESRKHGATARPKGRPAETHRQAA